MCTHNRKKGERKGILTKYCNEHTVRMLTGSEEVSLPQRLHTVQFCFYDASRRVKYTETSGELVFHGTGFPVGKLKLW